MARTAARSPARTRGVFAGTRASSPPTSRGARCGERARASRRRDSRPRAGDPRQSARRAAGRSDVAAGDHYGARQTGHARHHARAQPAAHDGERPAAGHPSACCGFVARSEGLLNAALVRPSAPAHARLPLPERTPPTCEAARSSPRRRVAEAPRHPGSQAGHFSRTRARATSSFARASVQRRCPSSPPPFASSHKRSAARVIDESALQICAQSFPVSSTAREASSKSVCARPIELDSILCSFLGGPADGATVPEAAGGDLASLAAPPHPAARRRAVAARASDGGK